MTKSSFLQKVVPVLLLLFGVAILVFFIMTRSEPQKAEQVNAGALVRTVQARVCEIRPTVAAKGTLQARQRVAIVPQVSGKVAEIAPQFEAGGMFRRGEMMLQIEKEDYQLALENEKSRLLEAQANLEEAEARHEAAKKELELYRGESVAPGDKPLVLGIPQLKAAEAAVKAAEAALAQAELNLERSTVRAPFDGIVTERAADIGQLVSSNSEVAELIGTDALDVLVSVPVEHLPDIKAHPESGSRARIPYGHNGETRILLGRVVRQLPQLDPAGRMAQVLVRVENPFQIADQSTSNGSGNASAEIPPVLLNTYVDVEVEAVGSVEGVLLPREYVHEGDQVHLYRDGQLVIRPVDVRWRQPEALLVQGVREGEQIVTTRLAAPVEGLQLRKDSEQEVSRTSCQSGARLDRTKAGAD
jgi:RND family efflux transporter MFP subunit